MRNAQKVTSVDVARRAGVSQSAVSRVFTPGASVSADMTEKVRRAAAELGYSPNPLARAMITGKSRIIGLVVAYLDNQFYPLAIERLSHALQAEGYHVLLFMASNSEGEIEKVVTDLLAYRVDGIITASVAITNDMTRRCADAGIPVVLFNRGQPGSGLSSVTSANVEGGRKVAAFLHQGGHKQIAHISGWQGSLTGRERQQGFEEGLAALDAAPLMIIDGMYDRASALAATETLLRSAVVPDAIFVGNDHMAFVVIDTLRQNGLRVPQDISVVGYDDVPISAWPAYDLTTVRQPMNRMVEATVDTLLAQIADPDRPAQKIEIGAPLMVRGSARLPQGQAT
ncbi:LacI family DNA-binding transcriptional regulator [Yoonia vestfoldensis]|uniref:LacI family DNA-binding transcriptional regulator n=1 Tax=Yoonia vestfoldensis TaxID=245188 RepID=UPI0003A15F03|nr:LacI family DNA-binding transcriptional regulator [Yoonia vestfoldensis]